MFRLLAILLCAAPCFAQQVDWISQIRNKPVYDVRQYAFTRKPGGSLVIGANTVVVQPCPLGVAGTDTAHWLYLSGGTGTAESVLITGGTCATGMGFGTVVFTAAHTHSGAWTVASASFGVQEAVLVAGAAGGGTVLVPAGTYVLHATISMRSNILLQGAGGYGSNITRTEDFGDSIYGDTLLNVHVAGLHITHTINYAAGPPPTVVNKPSSGAHVHFYGCNVTSVTDNRFENMPYGVEVDTSALNHIERNAILSVWDYLYSAVQIGIAGVYLHHSANLQGFPTYTWIKDNTILAGGVSTARDFVVNGHTIHQAEPVGAKNGIWVAAAEVLNITGNDIEGQDSYGINISPLAAHAVTDPILQIKIDGNYIDSNRLSNLYFDNSLIPTVSFALNTSVTNNELLGSGISVNSIYVTNAGSIPTTVALRVAHNYIYATLGSAIYLLAGNNTSIEDNTIVDYNYLNSFPTNAITLGSGFAGVTGDRTNNAGVFISGSTTNFKVLNNHLGGSYLGGVYNSGTGPYTVNGVVVAVNPDYGLLRGVSAPNFDGGVQPVASRSPAVAYDPGFYVSVGPVSFANESNVVLSGCGTLSAFSTLLSGQVTSGTTGTCSVGLAATFAQVPNGLSCSMNNITHPGGTNAMYQSATNTSSASFTGVTVSGDVLNYSCVAY